MRKFSPSLIVLGQQDDLLPRFQAIGIEPVMLRLTPGRWPLAEIGRFLAAVREIQPDILQGWMYHGNLAASFAAARLQPAPTVCWSVRDTPDAAHAHSLFTRLVIRFSGLYLARVATIFNVSARSAEYCARNLGWPAERTRAAAKRRGYRGCSSPTPTHAQACDADCVWQTTRR
ncbi:MAG: glycosyltransferase [Uliginosibacterium sp.]|nr:glycosyltransferase [Uliginosibacterium sp.]